jgi:type IV pilus assembly protein PilW
MTIFRSHRGFTLIEAVISMAVSAIVLAGAIVAANAQTRAFHEGQRLRTAQASSRDALVLLERTVPLAGYGMDPALAIDFQWYTPAMGLCPAEMGTCPRDATNNTDELVFYARNPDYWVAPVGTPSPPAPKGKAWMLSSITATDVHLDAHQGDQFLPGQILQAVCPGTLNYAYFTVKTAVGPLASDTAATEVDLVTVDTANPFKRQDVAVTLAMGTACRVFQIDRYRLHVKPVALGNNRYDSFLVLDDGVHPEVLLVEGVEAFQVAYVFVNPAVGMVGAAANTPINFVTANADQTVSGTGAERIAKTNFPGNAPQTGQTTYSPSSFLLYSYTNAARQSIHQANIRALQIGMIVRSPEPDSSSLANIAVGDTFEILNQHGIPNWVKNQPKTSLHGSDGFQRVQVETTINLPNMLVRSLPAF